MPDSQAEIPQSTSTEIKTPREDVLKIVGLSAESAKIIAEKEAKNILRLETSKKHGRDAAAAIEQGAEIDRVNLGSGQFPIPPVDSIRDFVNQTITRSAEINPPPPKDEIAEMLEGVAEEILKKTDGKEFEVAVACFNYISGEKLKDNEEHLKKLKDAAVSDQDKYELAKALEQVIPAPAVTEPTINPPVQNTIVPNPEIKQEENIPLNRQNDLRVDTPPIIPEDGNLQMPPAPAAAVTSAEQTGMTPPPQPLVEPQTDKSSGLFGRILRPVQPQEDTQDTKIAA